MTKATGEWIVSGSVDEGVILAPLAARTTAGNTQATKHDNTAESHGGGYGYLQLTALALGGYTNLVVTLQHSTDNITYVDFTPAFTARTAVGAERITLPGVDADGNVYQYTAVKWAWTGSGTGQSATFMAGIVRNG